MSGIKAKTSDKVKLPQKSHQARLQFGHVNKQVKFEELDFKSFIAGELKISSEADISKTRKECFI